MTSLLLAAAVSWRNRGGPWRPVAALLVLMALDIVTGASWAIHDAVGGALKGSGMYAGRATAQLAIMVAIGAVAVTATILLARRYTGPARHAVLAASALASLFAIAPVSLHAVDAVLGRPVGPVMAMAVFWAAGAAWIGGAALAERRRRVRRPEERFRRS